MGLCRLYKLHWFGFSANLIAAQDSGKYKIQTLPQFSPSPDGGGDDEDSAPTPAIRLGMALRYMRERLGVVPAFLEQIALLHSLIPAMPWQVINKSNKNWESPARFLIANSTRRRNWSKSKGVIQHETRCISVPHPV